MPNLVEIGIGNSRGWASRNPLRVLGTGPLELGEEAVLAGVVPVKVVVPVGIPCAPCYRNASVRWIPGVIHPLDIFRVGSRQPFHIPVHNTGYGSTSQVAWTCCDYADTLLQRNKRRICAEVLLGWSSKTVGPQGVARFEMNPQAPEGLVFGGDERHLREVRL